MEKTKWYARPWYEWIGWVIWFLVTITFLQAALANRVELEMKASLISWVTFLVLVIFAGVVWGMRIARKK